MELLPCPFCGCAMRIRSNRDTHKLVGDHTEACIYDDDPIIETPATDEILADIVEAWNRRASPAGAPAVCSPTLTECPRCHNDVKKCDGVFAAPTPPVSEDRKDAERYRWLRDIGNNTWEPMIKRGTTATQCDSAIDAEIAATQEDKS